jgi:hypothetical protein
MRDSEIRDIRGSLASVGVDLATSFARLENNAISACVATGAAVSTMQMYGIRQSNGASANEPDVHSNTIDGGRIAAACTGHAVSILAGTGATARGVYRNNVLHAGLCTTARYGLREMTPESDPRIVQNNDFWNALAGNGMYFDEATTAINTAAGINALADIVSGGNLVADPAWVGPGFADLHLTAGSACVNAGTSTGAPAGDFDTPPTARPAGGGHDIGADEHTP